MSKITIKEYQEFTPKTFIVSTDKAMDYLISGLAAEAGEVAGVRAKYLRGDYSGEVEADLLCKEIGDCFYFLFQLSNQIGLNVEDILIDNKQKLEDRLRRNVIKGSGDNR